MVAQVVITTRKRPEETCCSRHAVAHLGEHMDVVAVLLAFLEPHQDMVIYFRKEGINGEINFLDLGFVVFARLRLWQRSEGAGRLRRIARWSWAGGKLGGSERRPMSGSQADGSHRPDGD